MTHNFVRKLTHKYGREIEILIGAPIQEDDVNGDWQCSYKIDGLGSSREKVAMGIDAIQAFSLALTYAATALYFSDEYERGELTWEGGMTVSDLGLPLSDTIRDDVEKKKAVVEAWILEQDKSSGSPVE